LHYFNYQEPVFRPPSEARSLIFQITIGCSQNHCRFCGMYKMKQFRLRSPEEIFAEIDAIPVAHRTEVRRIFLADGDALVYPQAGLLRIMDRMHSAFPNLSRFAAYASPRSLTSKTPADLKQLRQRQLRILYFGLESADPRTLELANKGYRPDDMLDQCRTAQAAGIKLSVTAILGLGGRERSTEHAAATADWITRLSPAYFSLLTLFRRHNDAFFNLITPLSRGQVLEEALAMVRQLQPQRTLLRSNHVSNQLALAGSYPKDRLRLIETAAAGVAEARRYPQWFNEVPDHREDLF
jgi:radical SAM superfamily enzyme YgiQ (UPF0313 family)